MTLRDFSEEKEEKRPSVHPLCDCHIHTALDGVLNYKEAMGRHKSGPVSAVIRTYLETYRRLGFTYLRDGGDKYGVSLAAARLAPEYGITYVSPAWPIYREGCYGAFIGKGFATMEEFREHVAGIKAAGADFLKIMASGILDFGCFGGMVHEGPAPDEIREMIHIGKEEGLAVMVHVNGAERVLAAIRAGADSIEHGYYMNPETIAALAESRTVWVPTLVTCAALTGTGRHDDREVARIADAQRANIAAAYETGARIAVGSDAGAFAVPHGTGSLEERRLLSELIPQDALADGSAALMRKFAFLGEKGYKR